MSDQVMSPEYPTVQIGIRKSTRKKVEILFLSWHDARSLQNIFVKVIQTCASMVMENKAEEDIYKFLFVSLCDSVEEILPYITEEDVSTKDITIDQIVTIAKIVYEQNFEIIAKNAESLLQKLNLGKTLPQSQQ